MRMVSMRLPRDCFANSVRPLCLRRHCEPKAKQSSASARSPWIAWSASPPRNDGNLNCLSRRSARPCERVVECYQRRHLRVIVHEGAAPAVPRDRRNLSIVEPKRVTDGAKILSESAAEIGGIVGIDRDKDVFLHHRLERMTCEIGGDAETEIGEW